MNIQSSKHALEQARERGIGIKEIERAIQKGAKHLQEDKIVADFGYIRVVYRKLNQIYFIITVMIKNKVMEIKEISSTY